MTEVKNIEDLFKKISDEMVEEKKRRAWTNSIAALISLVCTVWGIWFLWGQWSIMFGFFLLMWANNISIDIRHRG